MAAFSLPQNLPFSVPNNQRLVLPPLPPLPFQPVPLALPGTVDFGRLPPLPFYSNPIEIEPIVPEEVVLQNHQIEHAEKVIGIVTSNLAYKDTSDTGLGKTFIVQYLCQQLGYKLLVIAPAALKEKWVSTSRKTGVELIDFISYSSFRGKKGSELRHPYLVKEETTRYYTDRKGNQQTKIDISFKASDHFKNLKREHPFIVVLDESHKCRNSNTITINAVHALIKEIKRSDYGCRIALLSATPFVKDSSCESYYKMMGIISYDKLFYYDHSEKCYVLTGMLEVMDFARKYDPETVAEVEMELAGARRPKLIELAHKLYIKVIKYQIASSMTPFSISANKDCKNGRYFLTQEDEIDLEGASAKLASIVRFDEETDEVDTTELKGLGKVVKINMAIEWAKRNTMVRLILKTLDSNPNAKVIAMCGYKRTLDYINNILLEYGHGVALIHTGVPGYNARYKNNAISAFQEESTIIRVLLSTPGSCGTGIDLDDQSEEGLYPRTLYIMPSYNFIPLVQSCGRIYRASTKSDAKVRFIYSRNNNNEKRIYQAILKKGVVLKDTVYDPTHLSLPGDFEDLYEMTIDNPEV